MTTPEQIEEALTKGPADDIGRLLLPDLYGEGYTAPLPSLTTVIRRMGAELYRLRQEHREHDVDAKTIAEWRGLLEMIPPCLAHPGVCVPHVRGRLHDLLALRQTRGEAALHTDNAIALMARALQDLGLVASLIKGPGPHAH